jgi:hypothetical protein
MSLLSLSLSQSHGVGSDLEGVGPSRIGPGGPTAKPDPSPQQSFLSLELPLWDSAGASPGLGVGGCEWTPDSSPPSVLLFKARTCP